MESEGKVELIQLAIQQLMEEEQRAKISNSSSDARKLVFAGDGDDHHLLLSRLLSQLETLKGDSKLQQLESPASLKELPCPAMGDAKNETANEVESGGVNDSEREVIIRELKNIKKQNLITHCLLSVMIVLTVAWQLSEVTLVLKVKDGLSNPFRSFGNILTGFLKGSVKDAQIGEKLPDTKQQKIECPSIPPLQIPELAHLDLQLGL